MPRPPHHSIQPPPQTPPAAQSKPGEGVSLSLCCFPRTPAPHHQNLWGFFSGEKSSRALPQLTGAVSKPHHPRHHPRQASQCVPQTGSRSLSGGTAGPWLCPHQRWIQATGHLGGLLPCLWKGTGRTMKMNPTGTTWVRRRHKMPDPARPPDGDPLPGPCDPRPQ